LRGWKYLVYEGGVRVPFVVQWPKQISTAGISDQILSLTDIIATFADITGQKIPMGQARDSLSMSQIIAGKRKTGPRHSVALQGVFDAFALRDEQWKFIKANAGAGATGIGRGADP